MNNNEIMIVVSGAEGVGKTTIIGMIERALLLYGTDVKIIGEHERYESSNMTSENFLSRVVSVVDKNKTKVNIISEVK